MKMQRFRLIELEEAVGKYRHSIHSSHILFWTKDNSREQEVIYGLMQMKSDGRFGFPGGKSDEQTVDEKEIVSALYREIKEEIDFNAIPGQITLEDRVFSHVNRNGKVLHFFVKELSLDSFERLERTHMNARDFPEESLGLIRIPLKATGLSTYEPTLMFFANFGEQHFAGNTRNQLIDSVIKLNLIGKNDRKFFIKMMSN